MNAYNICNMESGMTSPGMLNWIFLWKLLLMLKQVPNEWFLSKSQYSGLSEILHHFNNIKGFVSLCFDSNLPKCVYRQGWLCNFFGLQLMVKFFKYICLSTFEYKKPQLVLITVLYIFHSCSAPSLWEPNLCISPGPWSNPLLSSSTSMH